MRVGPIQKPGPSFPRPSTNTFAPAFSASVMEPSIRCFASFEITGPIFKPRMIETMRLMMWSVLPTAIITDAAMQRCPAQPDIEATTFEEVMSGSASGMTIR